MKVRVTKKCLKDLSTIPKPYESKVYAFIFNEAPHFSSIDKIPQLERLKGYKHYYKKRFGDYRLGLRYDGEILYFERVLLRKEIYRYYP